MNNLSKYIKQTSSELNIDENIVEAIIKDQWKNAYKAAHNLREIEVKDLSIFYPSPKKVFNVINKYNNRLLTETNEVIIGKVNVILEDLKKTKYYDITERYLAKQGADIGGNKE